jgi:hypothetical protein
MRKNIIVIVYVLLFLSVQCLWSQTREAGTSLKKKGTTTFNFLQVGVVPEAVALGEAYTSIGTGVRSMFYNPAGLSEMTNKFEVFVSSMEWIADIQYFASAAAWNAGEYGTIGVNFLTVDYGDIIGTEVLSEAEAATHPLGYIETGLVDNVGAYAFGVSYAKRITNDFMVGLNVRYAAQQLGQGIVNNSMRKNEESNFVFDLGVRYYTPIKSFRFAMSIRNFSSSVKYEEISFQLPFTFTVGVAMDVMNLIYPDHDGNSSILTTAEFSHPNNYTERIHLGIEYNIMDIFSLRGGYITNHDIAGLSLGVGIKADIMNTSASINYTYSAMEIFDDVNRFSVSFAF